MSGGLQKLGQWLKATETPRYWLVLFFIVTSISTTGLSYLSNIQLRHNDVQSKQVQELVDIMSQFPVFASAFATEIFDDGKPSASTKRQLIENINSQQSKISAVESFFPNLSKGVFEEYRDSLLQMRRAIDGTDGVQTMRNFWAAASRLTVARNRVNGELRPFI